VRSARTSSKRTAADSFLASTLIMGNSHGERAPGTVFRDCPECPEMIVISGGQFSMGSPAAEKSCAIKRGATTPQDGRSVEMPDGCMRVDRGGSWYYPSWLIRPPLERETHPSIAT
jgi:formylglycine-generating enzyme required for sulfatase activity